MKQATFVVEILIQDKNDLILVRDPRSGQVVKTCSEPSELASFLSEVISTVKSQTSNKNVNE